MNIPTITMPTKEARERYLEYRRAVIATPNPSDEALMRGYKALSKGKTVIDLQAVMQQAGLDEQQRPKLAIVRADAREVYCRVWNNGSARYSMDEWPNDRASRRLVLLPSGTFGNRQSPAWIFKALVPSIPPRYRPRYALSNYHILWEADWQDVPRDPILLRRLSGMLFAVLASWELTELERAVLRR